MSDDLVNRLMNLGSDSYHQPVKSPFIWCGGKSKLASKILPLIPDSDVYVEPFGGSAAIMLSKPPTDLEVHNDYNSGVCDFYRCIQNEKTMLALVARIEHMISSRELFNTFKMEWKTTADPVERAAYWYYTIQLSFSGRGLNWGRATSPDAQNTNKLYLNLPLFPRIQKRLRDVQIENCDWEACMREFDSPDTVFYCDPPYLGTQGYEWTEAQQIRLLKTIFEVEGYVLLSGYDCPFNDPFPFMAKYEWEVTTSVINLDGRKVAKEMLWVKEQV